MDLHAGFGWLRTPLALVMLAGTFAAPAVAAERGSARQTEPAWTDTARHDQRDAALEQAFAEAGTAPVPDSSLVGRKDNSSAAYAAPVPLSPVPEPHIAYMLATGIAVLVLRARRPSDHDNDRFDPHDDQGED